MTLKNDPPHSLEIELPIGILEEIAERAAELLATRSEGLEDPVYMTVAEAADYLRCKPKRVYDLVSQHRLPFVKDGSRTLLRRADLDAYLEGDS